MKNGTVFAWAGKESDTWLIKLVDKAIAFITKSKYTHTAVVLNDVVYESTIRMMNGKVHNGVQSSPLGFDKPDEVWEPIRDLTELEVIKMVTYAEACISLHIPYSIIKLIVLAIVYPTRKFWDWIKWFPFQSQLMGEVCSEFVTQDFLSAGIDLTPGTMPEDDAPIDVINSGFFKKVG